MGTHTHMHGHTRAHAHTRIERIYLRGFLLRE